MKITLTPGGIARREIGHRARRGSAFVYVVHIGDIKNHPTPPFPSPLPSRKDQVEGAGPRVEGGKVGVFAAFRHNKPEALIKSDRSRHVVGRERDRADTLDTLHDLRFNPGCGHAPAEQ